jgi:hypothetical protein
MSPFYTCTVPAGRDYSQLFTGLGCKLDGRHNAAALTVPVEGILKRFPVKGIGYAYFTTTAQRPGG